MTSRERFWAAVRGEPLDMFPVAPRVWRYAGSVSATAAELARTHDFEVSECGFGLPTAIHDIRGGCADLLPDIRVEIRRERRGETTRVERRFLTPGGALRDVLRQPDPGGAYGIAPNPEWEEPLVKDAADVELLPYLLPPPERVRERTPDIRRMEEELGDAGVVAARPSIGPDHLTVDCLGVTRALTASIVEPELLDRTLAIMDGWHTHVTALMLEEGLRLIFDPLYNFSLSVGWSPAFYRRTVMPLLKRHADLVHAHGGTLFFYDDGRMARSVGYMIEAGADIIETLTPAPAGDIVYEELAREHGGRACFKGGIDTVRIRFGSPREIEETVRAAFEALGPTRRFILSASDSIVEGTPEENVRAFFAAGRRYGRAMAKRLYG